MGDNLDFSGPPLADAAGSPTAEAAPQGPDYTDDAGNFFLEGGLYGQADYMTPSEAQAGANRESFTHRDGALFGLGLGLGVKQQVPTWASYVPRVNSLKFEGAKYLGVRFTEVVLRRGIDKVWEEYVTDPSGLLQFITDYHEKFEPLIADLARYGPGLGDIKEFPTDPGSS